MKSQRAEALTRTVAEAVLAVPDVACLRPGLRSLLLHTAGKRLPAGRDPGDDPGAAVRITYDAQGSVAGLQVDVVVRAGQQAARTAGAVRAAAAEAAAAPPGAVRVTVTGIV
ncbi:hypothetical protein [Streptomyces vinaceus]|uniref:hypothetical protein n=1 Tax=Streptomyces vinaceus TaxID=1960 RepID=UPI00368AF09A